MTVRTMNYALRFKYQMHDEAFLWWSHVVPTSFIACWDYFVDAVYGEENGYLSALDKGTPLFII